MFMYFIYFLLIIVPAFIIYNCLKEIIEDRKENQRIIKDQIKLKKISLVIKKIVDKNIIQPITNFKKFVSTRIKL